MKTLQIRSPHPVGTFVDHMKRNEKGQIEKVSSFSRHSFESLYLNFDLQDYFEQSMENRSMTQLATMALNKTRLFHENRWLVHTYLYFKLFMPWLPVLVLIGLIPFCVVSSRNDPTFIIFSLTVFWIHRIFYHHGWVCYSGRATCRPPILGNLHPPDRFFLHFWAPIH